MNDRPLPPYVRLHELRRDAKGLLECALDGDVPCLERFYAIGREPSLTAAQLLIARDRGFSSWAKLKQQVERNAADPRTEFLRQLISRHDRAPDEIPAIVPYNQVVATTPDTKVMLNYVRVHSDRCMIELQSTTCIDVGKDSLRVTGVRFADGRTFNETTDWMAAAMAMANPGAEVWAVGLGGSQVSIWPLPPPGDLGLTIAWPRAGIPAGTSFVVNATPIHSAVGRIRPFTLGAAADDASPGGVDEPVSAPEAPTRRPRSLLGHPSEDRLSEVVPVGEIVARSSRLAIAVHAVRVHRTWCMFEIERITPRTADPYSPCTVAILRMFDRNGPYVDGRTLSPRYGVEFSDGRAVEYSGGSVSWPGGEPSDDPPSPELRLGGGGNGFYRGQYDVEQTGLMLAPLPPPGELRFWFAWPDLGVPETTTILDGTAIHQAAQRVRARQNEWPAGPGCQ